MRDVQSEEILGLRCRRVGEWLERLSTGVAPASLPEGRYDGFRVRLPTEQDPSTLLVVRASAKGEKWIAFVGAYTVADAVLAWRARDLEGTVKWREDVPWSER